MDPSADPAADRCPGVQRNLRTILGV